LRIRKTFQESLRDNNESEGIQKILFPKVSDKKCKKEEGGQKRTTHKK
jgi:hypothetical protein